MTRTTMLIATSLSSLTSLAVTDTKMGLSNNKVDRPIFVRSCITSANFRLAKLEKAEFT